MQTTNLAGLATSALSEWSLGPHPNQYVSYLLKVLGIKLYRV